MTAFDPSSDPSHSTPRGGEDPLDFLDVDALLDDEERLLRDTVRQFVADRVLPDIAEWFEHATFPRELGQGDGQARPARHAPQGLRLRRHQRRRLRPGLPRARGGRQRHPQLRLGAGLARDVPDLEVRLRGAEAGVAAPHGRRRGHRLLRPHRARLAAATPARCAPAPGATATTGCSTAPRCGSPTAAWPTWPSSGPGPRPTATGRARSTASSSPPTRPGFVANDITQKMSLRASVTSELVLDRRAHPRVAATSRGRSTCGVRCRASTRPATASSGAPPARPAPATRRRCAYAVDARAVRQADRLVPAHPAQARRDDGARSTRRSWWRCTSVGCKDAGQAHRRRR